MTVPETAVFRRPTLEALADGASRSSDQIDDRVQQLLGLSDEDRSEMPLRGPATIFTNRVAWALVYLQDRELIVKVAAGPNTYRITEFGHQALADNLDMDAISPRRAAHEEIRPSGQETEDGAIPATQTADQLGAPEAPRPFGARPFDPDRPPQRSDYNWAELDPEATHQLVEKARQRHHGILVALEGWLRVLGWASIEEVPGSVDLLATSPGGRRWLFEAKTISQGNELSQTRSGLAQLLEYRVALGDDSDGLCLVVDRPITAARAGLMAQLEVAVLEVVESELEPKNEAWEDRRDS
jgi:hypothetical protein